jgi:DNA polymerase/3'-5' exonuclease PolX
MPSNYAWIIGGSWRRQAPDIGDLDVMVVTATGNFENFPFPPSFQAQRRGEKIAQGDLVIKAPGGVLDSSVGTIHVDFWAVAPKEQGAFLMFITGPKALNIEQRAHAQKLGLTLSQYGLFDREGNQLDDGTEEIIYACLNLPWLNPVVRQAWQRIADAQHAKDGPERTFKVKSDSNPGEKYTVVIKGNRGTCTCLAYKYNREPVQTCKHIKKVLAKIASG